MTCCELYDFIDDYLDGSLTPELATACESHMAACTACRSYLASYTQTVRASRCCCDADSVAERSRSHCAALPGELVRSILSACGCRKSTE